MVSGIGKCAKYTLCILNLLYFAAGIGLIVVGSLATTTFRDYIEFFAGKVNIASIFLIVIGAVIFLVAFFGCCGAVRESYGMVVVYIVLLGLIIILQIAAFIALYVSRAEIQEKLPENMEKTIPKYNETDVTKLWDFIQGNLGCCGAKNFSDWSINKHLGGDSVPDSCCVNATLDCGKHALNKKNPNIHQDGCMHQMENLFDANIYKLIAVVGGIVVLKFIGIILGVILANSIHGDYQSV